MDNLILGAWILSFTFLTRISLGSPEVIFDKGVHDQEICAVEIRNTATLGTIQDPISVQIPTEAYVASVPWGGWVVTEDGNDVIEYDASGGFRSILGRRGEGPGELHKPNAVAVDPTDSTWISDKRGRVVVFGPDGLPARTLLSPNIYQIEGFTKKGLPYAMMLKVDRSGGESRGWRYIQTWSREGEPLYQLGPGHFAPGARGVPYNEAPSFQGVLVGDTLGVVPGAWENWLMYWSASRERVFAPADSVWRTLGINDAPRSYSDGRPIAVSSDGTEGYWVIGVVRRLSESHEKDLARKAPTPRGETDEFYRLNSTPVRNAVFDGAIIHVKPDGTITGGVTFDQYPGGFSGLGEFYSFAEGELGLIQINIWQAKLTCR